MKAASLTEALALRGYSHVPAVGGMYAHAVIRNGRIVRVGNAHSNWKWLQRLDRKLGRTWKGGAL